MSRLQFTLEAEAAGSRARAARFRTLHNEVLTPVFMPVGTQATVKGMHAEGLLEVDAQVLLANTYHLLLRPGPEVFTKVGGIHKFMKWPRSVLTDSGGFQIFSLPNARKMSEDGAEFRSYVDGKRILLSPEVSIATQKAIGSDIMMVLDQCVPSTVEHQVAKTAMHLTHRWAVRSLRARGDSPQSLFGIVQGACYEDLRKESAGFLTELPFDGFAIGGLAVGESKSEREDFTALTTEFLPRHLPRYLMGVGTPIDLLEAVHRGVDMFDCILPSAHAQQGTAFTFGGGMRLRRSAYKFDEEALDPRCSCSTCRTHSRAYLHHLVKADEGLGWRLIAHHNLHFYQVLMREIRQSIFDGCFLDYYRVKREQLVQTDSPDPETLPKPKKRKESPTQLGNFTLRLGPSGRAHIQQISSGEAMHPTAQPDQEAHELYVEQSRLRELLSDNAEGPVVIWDVGLGAAHNAMAAIRCAEDLSSKGERRGRPLHIVSFENDLDAFRLALCNLSKFPHLKHAAPHYLTQSSHWATEDGSISWTLLHGDFMECLVHAPAPDVIFYDPFSYKTDTLLWTLSAFEKVREACNVKPCDLLTYSTSTAVRAALLAAGFFVGRAKGVGGRDEATVAFVGLSTHPKSPALDRSWLARWERSSARYPYGLPADAVAQFDLKIRSHVQFQQATPQQSQIAGVASSALVWDDA